MICEFSNCPHYIGTVRGRLDRDVSEWTIRCTKVNGEPIRASHCPKQNNSTLDGWC